MSRMFWLRRVRARRGTGAGGRLQQEREVPIGVVAHTPPRGDADLDVPVLHRREVRGDHTGQVARVVEAERRVVVRERVQALLLPRGWVPRVVEGAADRER